MNSSFRAPWWTPLILLGLAAGPALVFESAFGSFAGLIASLGGVAVGLLIASLSKWLRWDFLTTFVVTAAAYLGLGGVAAARETTIAGFIPTLTTIRVLVVGIVNSWRDLLTVHLPAAGTTGPAVLPWFVGIVCGLAAGLLTIRWGRPLLGAIPLLVLAGIAVAWGPSGWGPPAWQSAVWGAALLAWLAWAAQRARIGEGREVVLGVGGAENEAASLVQSSGRSVRVVHAGRRLLAALLTLAVAGGAAVFVLDGRPMERIVLRDLVEPPLRLHDYASPLASYRHYTTDLADETMVRLSELPSGARVRVGVMDTWDGITFTASDPVDAGERRYVSTGGQLRPETDDAETIEVETTDLVGPWVPSVGAPQLIKFTGANGPQLADRLHVNLWADALLTTSAPRTWSGTYELSTTMPAMPSDGQLAGVPTVPMGAYTGAEIPSEIRDFGQRIAAAEVTALGKARAIERYLSKEGFYSSEDTPQSRPGHRADRLIRMLEYEQLIGDDEQYATLMALMLQGQGIPARVVMGYYPKDTPPAGQPVELQGTDAHVWVEVPFEGVGWAVFDPTPPRDQQPQTEVPEPRSVPRPQVLQPPDPPEPPVELPPNVTNQDAEDRPEPEEPFPWALVLGISGAALLLIGPILLILLLKAIRTARRKRGGDEAAIRGAWVETLDLAKDAGTKLPPHLTRSEAALRLTPTFHEEMPKRFPEWGAPAASVPTILALARRADTADFSGLPASQADADAAWADVKTLRKDLGKNTPWWIRFRRRLSLRSLMNKKSKAKKRRGRGAKPSGKAKGQRKRNQAKKSKAKRSR